MSSQPNSVIVRNTSETADKEPNGTQWYYWSIEIDTDPPTLMDDIERVTYYLHPTFGKTKFEMLTRPFILKSKGWGEFIVRVEIHFKTRGKIKLGHFKTRGTIKLGHHLLLRPEGNVTRIIV